MNPNGPWAKEHHVTKGQEIWTRNGEGVLARFKVTGTTEHGVNGVWLDGSLKGKEASVEKQTLSEMAAAARRGAAARRVDEEEEEEDRQAAEIVVPGPHYPGNDVPDDLPILAQTEPPILMSQVAGIGTFSPEVVAAYGAARPMVEKHVATIQEFSAAAGAKKEAVRAASRERVRKWRAAKKAVQS